MQQGNRRKRRHFTPEFKARVALEAMKEELPLAELAKRKRSVNRILDRKQGHGRKAIHARTVPPLRTGQRWSW